MEPGRSMNVFSILLTFALVDVCIGAENKTASTPRAKEPSCQGKTLGEWIALTKDTNEKVRKDAAWALGYIGPDAKPAIPAVTELLTDKNNDVRWMAAYALGRIGPDPKTAVPVLTELLKDRSEWVRLSAAQSLGNIGPAAIPAVLPFLTKISRGVGLDLLLPDRGGDIIDKHPGLILKLLDTVLPDEVADWPYGVGDVLEKIVAADATLLSDTRLQRLKRKWGAR